MILSSPTRYGDVIEYRTTVDRTVEQYLYASARPWFYMRTLAIAMCRRTPGLKVVFFTDDPAFPETIRTHGDWDWLRLEDSKDSDEENLILCAPNGTALYPATRWGLEDAPGLMYRARTKRWCRLTFDRDFRRRLLDGSLSADDFLKEVESDWVVGVWSDWEGIIFDVGPQFERLDAAVIDAAIAESNDQCI